jgi:hypothetical protein
MSDPDERRINELKGRVSSLSGKIETSQGLLEQYQADYDNYQEKLIQLGNLNQAIQGAEQQEVLARAKLSELSSGNKAKMANGLLSEAIGLLSGLMTSGVESIKIYIGEDVEILVEKYEKEYKDYSRNIDTHNRYVRELWGLGLHSYKIKELTITKTKLL